MESERSKFARELGIDEEAELRTAWHTKHLTAKNFLKPDPQSALLVVALDHATGEIRPVRADERAESILGISLSDRVPAGIRRRFEEARGMLVFGYYYHPLYLAGIEQVYLLLGAALEDRYRVLGGPKKIDTRRASYMHRVTWLVARGELPTWEFESWQFTKKHRHDVAHPKDEFRSIDMPGNHTAWLRTLRDQIESLYRIRTWPNKEAPRRYFYYQLEPDRRGSLKIRTERGKPWGWSSRRERLAAVKGN